MKKILFNLIVSLKCFFASSNNPIDLFFIDGGVDDYPLAENVIKGFRINNAPSIPSIEELLSYICKYFDINISSLKSSKREQKLIYARKISYYILRKDLNLTWSIIGKILGNKNHSTVLQAYRSIEEDLKKSSLVRNDLQQIKNHFNF